MLLQLLQEEMASVTDTRIETPCLTRVSALVTWVPVPWRAAAQVLLHAWDSAVRVSSAVERWHSILRLLCWPFTPSGMVF